MKHQVLLDEQDTLYLALLIEKLKQVSKTIDDLIRIYRVDGESSTDIVWIPNNRGAFPYWLLDESPIHNFDLIANIYPGGRVEIKCQLTTGGK
jgi:hypothetical protein